MLKQKYFLTDFFILSAEKQPIKLSWRNIEWLHYIASSVLAVYLLGGIRFFIDKYFICLDQYLIDNILVFMLLLEVFLTFYAAIFIDKLRVLFLGNAEKKLLMEF